MPANAKFSRDRRPDWSRRGNIVTKFQADPVPDRTENRVIINRRAAFQGLALSLAAGRSWAATSDASALSPEDSRDVARVVDYLQGLTSAKGRFVQIDGRGAETRGTFYIQRPGRARFDYDAPSGLAIASDGQVVWVVDHRLKTIRSYPLSATPLALFLARYIRLDRGVKVSRVTRGDDSLTVLAEDARKNARGSIALTFAQSPLILTGWTLTDARGGVVKVQLTDFTRAEPHDAEFFKLTDPRAAGAPAGGR
jgi:outer membrane lipoprotein-sorting protein